MPISIASITNIYNYLLLNELVVKNMIIISIVLTIIPRQNPKIKKGRSFLIDSPISYLLHNIIILSIKTPIRYIEVPNKYADRFNKTSAPMLNTIKYSVTYNQ
jgi:hypothetical protein